MTSDSIRSLRLSSVALPLATPISDAKVLAGRQAPMDSIPVLFAEIDTDAGTHSGVGFTYATRGGGPAQLAHAREIGGEVIGADPSDIPRIWDALQWAGASVGRCGAAVQAIAAIDTALWDLKAKRAGLPLAKLIGAHHDSVPCYNSSGGYLHATLDEVRERADASLARGIGGLKLKVGQPDTAVDLARVRAVREHVGDGVPIMVDANQQWDRPTATRMIRALDDLDLTWVEEPLDAHDHSGHAALARTFDTPIATGEMLTSVAEQVRLIDAGGADVVQHDAGRIGGVTPFLRVSEYAEQHRLRIAPHFLMELHIHLAAAYPAETWVEHFEWLEPLFDERLEVRDGRMRVPTAPGLGLTVSEQARGWTTGEAVIGREVEEAR